jgi:hypothetical protein
LKSSTADSSAETPVLGLLGLALGALAALFFSRQAISGADLVRLYQDGFARAAIRLLPLSSATTHEADVLRRLQERADVVCAFDPERLRATPPFVLADNGRFWPAANDFHPSARIQVRWDGSESGELSVWPEEGPPWRAALRSKGMVQPDWSPYSGLVAYYDLGRVWIVDVTGKRYQSLVQEPLLDEGGVLKFSADGTALEFYFHANKSWMGQHLFVLQESPL